MSSPIEILMARIREKSGTRIPKGELWLGRDIFTESGLDDTLDNHFLLAERLGHTVVSLPVALDNACKPDLGYRYFSLKDIEKAVLHGDKPVFAVVDGPFQELVNTLGLMNALAMWASRRQEMSIACTMHSKSCLDIIDHILKNPPAAIVFTDDMAFDNGPIISPADIDSLCGSFYRGAVTKINRAGVPVFLHSCGNITRLIPVFKTWGLNGFAAIQSRLNDLESLYKTFDSQIMIMGGVENGLLDSYPFSGEAQLNLEKLLAGMGATGDLILGSSTGLYKAGYLEQIKRIYGIVDNYNTFNS